MKKKSNYMPLTIQMSDVIDENKFVVPQFQRNVVWKKQRRKDFINNIRNGEPFGVILVKQSNGKYVLIDGLQRITTIKDYYANPYDYLSDNDIDSEKARDIIVTYLEEHDLSVEETYISKKMPEIRIELFNCLKGGLKNWQAMKVIAEKFGYNNSDKIQELIDDIYDDFKSNIDIGFLPILAIDYQGPNENIPNVFYNLNTGGVQLSKYETYAALWSEPPFIIEDEQILECVRSKYKQLQEDSELDVIFNEDDLIHKGITLFEYCYALSGVIRNKDKGYNVLFGENTKSTDPIGFELLSLVLGENVNKAEKIYKILRNVSSEFLIEIKKVLDESIGEIASALRSTLKGKNGTFLYSDSMYLIYHIIISYIKEYYEIDIDAQKIIKKSDCLPIKDFKKYLPLHYVYDCITDYWKYNRQVSDLTRDINDANKRRKYWSNIKPDDWKQGLNDFLEAQRNVSKTVPQKNKLFIDFLMKLKLRKHPQFNVHFLNSDGEESGYLDFEHIVPRKKIQNKITDLTISQQNLFSVSNIGNLCYLTVKDNRSKRDKTIYEYVEDRPSYTFAEDFLQLIQYPSNEELKFINYTNQDFREEYAKFVFDRADAMCKQFYDLVEEFY